MGLAVCMPPARPCIGLIGLEYDTYVAGKHNQGQLSLLSILEFTNSSSLVSVARSAPCFDIEYRLWMLLHSPDPRDSPVLSTSSLSILRNVLCHVLGARVIYIRTVPVKRA